MKPNDCLLFTSTSTFGKYMLLTTDFHPASRGRQINFSPVPLAGTNKQLNLFFLYVMNVTNVINVTNELTPRLSRFREHFNPLSPSNFRFENFFYFFLDNFIKIIYF